MIRAIAFDFDGVLVESVDIKTNAFRRLFSNETPELVEQIVEYHLRNAGLSRFVKFKAIYRNILKRPLPEAKFQQLCQKFADVVVEEVVACPWVDGAQEFLQKYRERYSFFIVSGTPEEELQEIVRQRGMTALFREILGSPRTKEVLLQEVLARYALRSEEVIFVGDSETDWLASQRTGVKFVFRKSPGMPGLHNFSGPSVASLFSLDKHLSTG